ncbi:MAG: HD domain-containing protein [Oceanococcus sp.]
MKNVDMTCCAELNTRDGQCAMIQARVISINVLRRPNQSGVTTQIKLSDYSETCHVLVCWGVDCRVHELQVGMVVEATILVNVHPWGIGGLLKDWRVLDTRVLSNAAWHLPFAHCPDAAKESLTKLVRCIDEINAPEVHRSINVLVGELDAALLHATASWNDHHSFAGGLLCHTMEVVDLAACEAEVIFPGDELKKELIILMAFIHDIAKAERQSTSNAFIKGLGHKLGALGMAYSALSELAHLNPYAGELVGKMLQWLLQPPSYRKIRQCPEAELVQRADELSCIKDFVGKQPLPQEPSISSDRQLQVSL